MKILNAYGDSKVRCELYVSQKRFKQEKFRKMMEPWA
jgi:hypothetical protein